MKTAIESAIEIYRFPSQVPSARGQPLPPGIDELLHALIDDAANNELVGGHRQIRADDLREMFGFYVEHILLHSEADAYRTLGCARNASRATIRSNMALLLQWLHPDRNDGEDRTVYAHRVLNAWNQLKTDNARQAYDELLPPAPGSGPDLPMTVSRLHHSIDPKGQIPRPIKRHSGRKSFRKGAHSGRSRGFWRNFWKIAKWSLFLMFSAMIIAVIFWGNEFLSILDNYINYYHRWRLGGLDIATFANRMPVALWLFVGNVSFGFRTPDHDRDCSHGH